MDTNARTPRTQRVIVGTAGHIDHGKTTLVKALTGVDTDRWEEEQRRGITIDLGFAPLALGAGVEASLVDVPGHEGFVRNMLAGATGIDVALLVIAADEGTMPQTEEHLAIVELLGVTRGIPVLTKRDLVQDEWLELVRAEVVERLRTSRVRWESPVAVSALTGAGVDDVRAALGRAASAVSERHPDDWFRLPIDRVFSLPGAGTVVTGSTWSGSVVVGDAVTLFPLGREARVRSIEMHGQPAERALPGRRTALALVGVDRADLSRGDVAVTGPGWATTAALDAAIEVLPRASRPVAPRTRLRVHLGTAEVMARAVQGPTIAPGEAGVVRLLLEQPLVARGGDRFVLRSFSPVTTIGGGVVLDPHPPRSGPGLRGRRLDARQTPPERLVCWANEAGLGGLRLDGLAVRLGILPGAVAQVVDGAGDALVIVGEHVVLREAINGATARLAQVLRAYHAAHPLDAGMSVQAMRATLDAPGQTGIPVAIVDHVVLAGGAALVWEVAGSVAHLPGWRPAARGAANAAATRLRDRLAQAEWQIPTIAELEREFPGDPVRAVLAHLVREGGAEQVDRERTAARDALERFRTRLEAVLQEVGTATPAVLRDRLGLTRKFLIPLLEWADRQGITRRIGDARVLARLTARSRDS